MTGRTAPILRADWERLAQERVNHWWAASELAVGAPLGATPTVELSARMRTTAGLAIPSRRHIKLSFHMFRAEGLEQFDSTIGHEVAHVACDLHHRRSCHHDARWKRLMRQLGLPPDRCHEYSSGRRAPGIALDCPGCARAVRIGPLQWKRYLQAGARFQCTSCGTELTSTLRTIALSRNEVPIGHRFAKRQASALSLWRSLLAPG